MKKKPLGCLTANGLIALVITLLLIGGVGFVNGGSMFTPGELSAHSGEPLGGVTSHADLESQCSTCHAAPWGAEKMGDLCMACHTEIQTEMQNPSSLHGTLMQDDPALQCRACHPEHRGPDAALVEMDPTTFPHEVTGFALTAHAQNADGTAFDCDDCHLQNVGVFETAVCTDCHQQIDSAFTEAHTAAYGTDCLACHDGVETLGANFDHNQADFKLIGKHATTDCASCHSSAHAINDFKNTPSECVACHQKDDAHAGNFGSDCAACHTPENWEATSFDHNLLDFKLEGSHARVECEQCHANNVYQGTPTDCYVCHQKDDEHNGQFGTDCAACHTTSDWDNVSFDHNSFAFKLEGQHANVECQQCHINNVYQGTPTDCYACHQKDDQHNGQFGTDCAACHTTSDWDNVNFDHAGLTDCAACHTAPVNHYPGQCSDCHNTDTFAGATFNHTFPIYHEGANGDCATCHPGNDTRSYTCVSCHNQQEMISEHSKEGIGDISNCVRCHADGREHDD